MVPGSRRDPARHACRARAPVRSAQPGGAPAAYVDQVGDVRARRAAALGRRDGRHARARDRRGRRGSALRLRNRLPGDGHVVRRGLRRGRRSPLGLDVRPGCDPHGGRRDHRDPRRARAGHRAGRRSARSRTDLRPAARVHRADGPARRPHPAHPRGPPRPRPHRGHAGRGWRSRDPALLAAQPHGRRAHCRRATHRRGPRRATRRRRRRRRDPRAAGPRGYDVHALSRRR